MNLPYQRTGAGFFLVLLLLCSVGIAPVMAGTQTNVVEDGVHLVKFDDSPTILDHHYYDMLPTTDFVVDGDQFYWVRIGSVKAKGLTTVWWAKPLAATALLILGFLGVYCWHLVFKRYFPEHYTTLMSPQGTISRQKAAKAVVIFFVPFFCIFGFTVLDNTATNTLSNTINHIACEGYADLQASDGTILLTVDKIHPETNSLYMKSGLNLTTLTHLPSAGNALQRPGVSPP